MNEQKKNERLQLLPIFLVALIVGATIVGVYICISDHITNSVWETKTISGYIKDVQLYNQFPTKELFIVLTNKEYVVVTENPFWAYAVLLNIDTSQPYTFTYEQSRAGHVKMKNISSLEVEA